MRVGVMLRRNHVHEPRGAPLTQNKKHNTTSIKPPLCKGTENLRTAFDQSGISGRARRGEARGVRRGDVRLPSGSEGVKWTTGAST